MIHFTIFFSEITSVFCQFSPSNRKYDNINMIILISIWFQNRIGWKNHSRKKTERNLRHRGKVARSQTESRSSWQRSTDQVRHLHHHFHEFCPPISNQFLEHKEDGEKQWLEIRTNGSGITWSKLHKSKCWTKSVSP